MSFNIYGVFDPNDKGITEEYVELTENSKVVKIGNCFDKTYRKSQKS